MARMTPADRAKRLKVVIDRDGPHCVWCSAKLSARHRDATLDHALPYAEDGSNRALNLLLACDACNGARGTLPLNRFAKRMEKQGYTVQRELVTEALERIKTEPLIRRSASRAGSGRASDAEAIKALEAKKPKATKALTVDHTSKPRKKVAVAKGPVKKPVSTRPARKKAPTESLTLVHPGRPRIDLAEELAWAYAA